MLTIEDRDFQRLWRYMHTNYGINLEKKRTLVEGRLGNTIVQDGYTSFHEYIEDVLNDKSGDRVQALIAKLTTNYTYFMREEGHYSFMTRTALPEWIGRIKNHDIRIWSAGCSSGEEAYTTAIVVSEFFGPAKHEWDSTILATDISPKVLAEAKTGVYPASHIERLPEKWQKKYFSKDSPDTVRINEVISKEVVFAQFNLMDSFTRFSRKFHIIFCRNVMIYFDNQTKKELARKFYDALEPGGYFFIGFSETLSGISDDFTQLAPAIYRKG